MLRKRGQAGAAAGFVAIVAGLIVLYILLLPADVRDSLLQQTTTSGTGSQQTTTLSKNVLVFEHPGTLDPVKLRDREKILDSFNLYSEKTAVVLKSAPAVRLESGWLQKKTYNLSFAVDDLKNTENYVLAFDVAQSSGNVIISLNGKEIYNSQVSIGNVEPIAIERSDIQSQNSLILSVSGVGLAFWKLNAYDLKNLRVIADFTDISKRVYKNFFVISATEKENFDHTKLNFVPNCLTTKVGPLKIAINDRDLPYSAIPDCGLLSTIEFDPNYLKQGENVITFSAEEGSYFVDSVSIRSELKQLTYPFYYFELKTDDKQKIDNSTANLTLDLNFADLEDKEGELNVNGHLSSILTSNSTFFKNLKELSKEGQNYIQIVPKTILNIVDLKVSLIK